MSGSKHGDFFQAHMCETIHHVLLQDGDHTKLHSTRHLTPPRRILHRDGAAAPVPQDTYMVHSKSPFGPWSEPVRVLRANTSKWAGREVLIDTNLAVTIMPDNSVVGIWRKCENTIGTVCESECCTFPHLLTATDWRDPSTYRPNSDVRIFPGIS